MQNGVFCQIILSEESKRIKNSFSPKQEENYGKKSAEKGFTPQHLAFSGTFFYDGRVSCGVRP